MSSFSKEYRKPTHEEIAACALRLYETEGRPQGKAMEHWLRAEAQLRAERKAESRSAVEKVATQDAAGGKGGRGAPTTSQWQTGPGNTWQRH